MRFNGRMLKQLCSTFRPSRLGILPFPAPSGGGATQVVIQVCARLFTGSLSELETPVKLVRKSANNRYNVEQRASSYPRY